MAYSLNEMQSVVEQITWCIENWQAVDTWGEDYFSTLQGLYKQLGKCLDSAAAALPPADEAEEAKFKAWAAKRFRQSQAEREGCKSNLQ